jgi:hypothetical protein
MVNGGSSVLNTATWVFYSVMQVDYSVSLTGIILESIPVLVLFFILENQGVLSTFFPPF